MLLKDPALLRIFQVKSPLIELQAINSLYDEAPELYDRLYGEIDFDIPFWKGLAGSTTGEILELGAGTGRVSVPLASSGASITGVDRSLAALKIAKLKAERASVSLDLVKDDFRALYLRKRFALVIAPANVINECFSPVDIDCLLDGVKRHLARDGRFVIAARNSVTTGSSDVPTPYTQRKDEAARQYSLEWQRVPYSHISQLCLARVGESDAGQKIDYYLAHRIYYPDELTGLLYRHGYYVESVNGDFKGGDLDKDSPNMIVTCKLDQP